MPDPTLNQVRTLSPDQTAKSTSSEKRSLCDLGNFISMEVNRVYSIERRNE